MEHVLLAKIITVSPGDDYKTVEVIELGDFLVNSKERVQEVAKIIGEKMNYENCRYEESDYPEHNEFLLTYDVESYDFPYSTSYETIQEQVRIEVVSCLKIHGKLFELNEFHQPKYVEL